MSEQFNTSPASTPVRDEHGQAAVEFALVLPVLCLILFAALECGTAFWHFQQLSAAASEGARKAAVSRTATGRDDLIRTAVEDASPALDSAQLGISSSSTWDPGDPVTVTVTYPEDVTVMGMTLYSGSLTSRRTARVEN